ncbi:MAG: hypothetical protein ABIK65_04230, partial [Candidatus Eisenbacteria bacterium]
MRLRRKLPLVPLAALFLWAGIALAFQEVPEVNRLEVPRAGWEDSGLWIGPAGETGLAKASPLSGLVARYGGHWNYNRNIVTGSLHRVYGSGFSFAAGIPSAETAERSARDFIGANADLFGSDGADLRGAEMQSGAGKWVAHFDQVVNGVRVVDGRAHVVFTESGRIFAFGSDVMPGVELSTNPSLSRAEALSIAGSDVGYVDGTDEITYEELVILPTRESNGEELALTYHLAYRFDIFAQNPYGHWETYVDASTGEILWRRSLIRHVDFTGNVQGDVEWMGYCDGVTAGYGLEQMRLPISGVGTAESDVNGDFSLPYGGTDTRTITSNFIGIFFNIDRYTGTNASYSGSITPGTPLTINWTNANSIASERDCWAYLNMQHRWLKALDPTFTGLDYQMPVSVERTDGYCPGNAWYDYYGVNFCVQSATYGNTGRMGDVAWHEYGHGITDQLYGPNDPGSGLHEGNSDVASLLFTRDPRLGLGFYLNNCTSGIRNAENTMQYPQDWSETHTGGQIISGFIWDSMQELFAAYPQAYADSVVAHAWHFGRRLGLPQNPPDQVYWTFVADDDDGDLDNGTPHHAAFCVGATNHGFDCPEILGPVHLTHTPVESQPSTVSPTAITATITSDATTINEGACAVYYRVDGGSYSNVGMANVGGDDYTGYIPAQTGGSYVEYYVYGEDDDGNSATHPTGAPINLHGFFVGTFTTIYENEFESNPTDWTLGVGDDDATTGMWEWGDPQGTTYSGQLQPEDDHTPDPGVNCFATGLLAGSSAGTYDVDGGKTTILSPVFDLSNATMAIVTYWRWYTNNQGNAPGEDFWVVQVNDGGGWVDLENTSASDNSWSKKQFALPSLSSTVQFRFVASDEINGSLVEAAVDDFLLEGILMGGVDPGYSTIAVNDDLMLSPNGGGDSTMTIVVTVKDGNDDPIVGVPAGDVAVTLSGTSYIGASVRFCQ